MADLNGPVLYSFRRCPYAMRARMALHVSGTSYEHREIVLRDKPLSLLNLSPKGTVPVFLTHNSEVIDESLDLMMWALKLSDPQGWLDCDQDMALQLISQNDGPFKHHLDRYKYASRYNESAQRGDLNLTHRGEAENFIQTLEDNLSQSTYLISSRQSLADIAIFPFIRQFANSDLNWWSTSPYLAVRNWLEHHINSELFHTIMIKHPVWKDEPS